MAPHSAAAPEDRAEPSAAEKRGTGLETTIPGRHGGSPTAALDGKWVQAGDEAGGRRPKRKYMRLLSGRPSSTSALRIFRERTPAPSRDVRPSATTFPRSSPSPVLGKPDCSRNGGERGGTLCAEGGVCGGCKKRLSATHLHAMVATHLHAMVATAPYMYCRMASDRVVAPMPVEKSDSGEKSDSAKRLPRGRPRKIERKASATNLHKAAAVAVLRYGRMHSTRMVVALMSAEVSSTKNSRLNARAFERARV